MLHVLNCERDEYEVCVYVCVVFFYDHFFYEPSSRHQ